MKTDYTPIEVRIELQDLRPGQRFLVPGHSIKSFWPNPTSLYQRDDHLEPPARAEHWCRSLGVTVVEMLDPPGLCFERSHT